MLMICSDYSRRGLAGRHGIEESLRLFAEKDLNVRNQLDEKVRVVLGLKRRAGLIKGR